MWVEEHYAKNFMKSLFKYPSDNSANKDDFNNYHRISNVFWLSFITPEDKK